MAKENSDHQVSHGLTRRDFLELCGGSSIGLVLAACGVTLTPVATTAATPQGQGYIDVHVHLLGLQQAPHQLGGSGREPGGAGGVTNYPAAAQQLVELMNRYGVKSALIMPPPRGNVRDPIAANEFQELLNAAARYPGRIFVAGGGHVLNPMIHSTPAAQVTDEVRARFQREAENLVRSGVRAFGEMAALHIAPHALDQVSPDHPLFLLLAESAAHNDIPIDLHMEAVPDDRRMPVSLFPGHSSAVLRANIPGLDRLLAHERRAWIVWQHVGWDYVGTRTVELHRRLLRAHPNLFLAIRAHEEAFMMDRRTPLPNRIHDANGRLKPEWLALFNEFPDRFVVGSDEFVGPSGILRGGGAQVSFTMTWPLMDQLSPELARKIGWENAARLYRMP